MSSQTKQQLRVHTFWHLPLVNVRTAHSPFFFAKLLDQADHIKTVQVLRARGSEATFWRKLEWTKCSVWQVRLYTNMKVGSFLICLLCLLVMIDTMEGARKKRRRKPKVGDPYSDEVILIQVCDKCLNLKCWTFTFGKSIWLRFFYFIQVIFTHLFEK